MTRRNPGDEAVREIERKVKSEAPSDDLYVRYLYEFRRRGLDPDYSLIKENYRSSVYRLTEDEQLLRYSLIQEALAGRLWHGSSYDRGPGTRISYWITDAIEGPTKTPPDEETQERLWGYVDEAARAAWDQYVTGQRRRRQFLFTVWRLRRDEVDLASSDDIYLSALVRANDQVVTPETDEFDLVEVPYTSQGDYAGSGDVGLANQRVFLETFGEHPGIHRVVGDYGYSTVMVWARVPNHASAGDAATRPEGRLWELLDMIGYLSGDGLVLDDEAVSEVDREWEEEAWENWARHDFRSALEEKFPHLSTGDAEAGPLLELFYELAEETNTYWEHENDGATIDIERIVEAAEESDVANLPGVKRTE